MRKTHSKVCLILLLFPILFSGCSRDCPAFPDESKGWLPYTSESVITLISDAGTIALPVQQTHITDSYSICKRWDCSCSAIMSVETAIDTLNLVSLLASIEYTGEHINLDQELPISVKIVLYRDDNEMIIESENDRFYGYESGASSLQDSAIIGDTYFKNVLILRNPENTRFQEIVLAKEIGIVKIVENDSIVWLADTL